MVVRVDEAGEDEHALAALLLCARVRAAELLAIPDSRDDAVADQDGAIAQGRRLGRNEHDFAADEEFGHADTLPAGAHDVLTE